MQLPCQSWGAGSRTPGPQMTRSHRREHRATSREDTTHPGSDRQKQSHLGPCALTWCLMLGEPKEPPRGRQGVFAPMAASLEPPAMAWAAGAGPHQGAHTPVDKQHPGPRGQHTGAHLREWTGSHLRAFTEVSSVTLPFCRPGPCFPRRKPLLRQVP